jgi:diguanylate cyclase (GGDEF)-like protein
LLVSSIFDSGYYASIRVVDLKTDQNLVERTGIPAVNNVPDWFVKLIGLEPAGGDAIVSRGWEQAARVEVVSHPMFALAKLWQSALGSLGWLLLCGAVSAVLGALLLRQQLRPLDYMVKQSHAIARREFLSLPELPRTPELRRVVQAMNQMVEKLKALFQEQAERSEKLRVESYQDSLTGLANRRYFEMQLNARVSNPEQASSGYLLLLRVKDLAGLNQRLGGQRTDEVLKAVGEQLTRECAKYPETQNLVTRIRGGEFAVLAPGLVREEALQLAQNLDNALASLHATGATDVAAVASIGLAPFAHGDSPQAVLSLGDQALAQAEGQGEQNWACLEHSLSASVGDDHHAWHQMLDQALTQRRFELYFQPVVAAQDTQLVLHYKVLSRLLDEHGQTIPAGRFLPWLERFGWTARLDRLMLERVLEQMSEHEESLALNLSSATLGDPQAQNKIFELLRAHSNLGPRLTLEIGEEQLPDQAVLEQLTRRLRELGFSLSLQRFGGRFSMIGNLARLGLAYLKIDGSYIRSIDLESEGELSVIREMGLYGVQGQLFGEPKPWK